MSTLEATVSMLQAMPEDARRKAFEYTRELFTRPKPANPFVPLTADRVLSDLEASRAQIEDGQGVEMDKALEEMGKRHGFI